MRDYVHMLCDLREKKRGGVNFITCHNSESKYSKLSLLWSETWRLSLLGITKFIEYSNLELQHGGCHAWGIATSIRCCNSNSRQV